MLSAIEFDGEASLVTVEIEDEATDRMLPAKLEPETAVSQQQPEQVLRIRLVEPERPGKVQHFFGEPWIHCSRRLPHPGPLPEGEGEFFSR